MSETSNNESTMIFKSGNMKKILIGGLLVVQGCMAFAQDCRENDSCLGEVQVPLNGKEAEPQLLYFNNEWIAGARVEMVDPDSILKKEVRTDEYGFRDLFITVSPETLAKLKADADEATKDLFINYDPICEFPGGKDKLKEWLNANIRVPEGYKGCERVVVRFYVQPEGSVTDAKIVKPSKNDAANAEALRLVSALPKFQVRYFTPKRARIAFKLPITFKEPGVAFISDEEFPEIKDKIGKLYENYVFGTAEDANFKLSDICTADFIQRLKNANDYDSDGPAMWLLRSGMQDGDDTPSHVRSIVHGVGNKVAVNWTDMGHRGVTRFTMILTDGQWKIDDATVPEGFSL